MVATVMAAQPGLDGVGLKAELSTLSQRTVFFGHQSVGMNVLDGLRELAVREQVTLSIVEAAPDATYSPGTVLHAFVAENGNPRLKLATFAQALGAHDPQIALVKFCFEDFSTETDVAALFESYKAALVELCSKHPRTTFVHVTAPLTTVQGGLKALVKRLLGRAPAGFRENERREAYSALIRAAYAEREPIFDIARIESTAPDGRREVSRWQGRTVPALVPGYTADGAHLNHEARLLAAREFIRVLAAAPVAPPAIVRTAD